MKMNNDSIEVKACGKLYILGEYAILTAGRSAVVKNVNIYINAHIKFSNEYKIYSDMYNHSVTMDYDKDYALIQETVNVVNEYLHTKEIKILPFELDITGKMEKDDKKYGIGSSGSVVILVIRAMAKLYKCEMDSDTVFKLAAYILLKRGDNGSMGDLACIVCESLVVYTSFNREKIINRIAEYSLKDVINSDWGYKTEKLECKKECKFLAGWTGKPAISKDMINNVKKSINKEFLKKSDEYVEKFVKGIRTGDKELIRQSVNNGGQLLEKLHKSIYSNELVNLVKAAENLDICAKSSGAGGGDCGIAISFNENDTDILIEKWEKMSIQLLYSAKL